jgi:hypothetical protein
MSQLTITGRDLKSKVIVSYGTEDAPKLDKNKKEYRVLIYNKVAFRVSEKVFQLWDSSKLASITLEEGEQVKKNDKGEPIEGETTLAYAYSGHETKEGALEELKYEAEVKNIERSISAETVKLTPEMMKKIEAMQI